MADFPKSSTMDASVLRKKPQVSRLDKAENSEQSANDPQQLPKQEITLTEERDDTLADQFKYGGEECMRNIINYLNSENEITNELKSRMQSHLSNYIGEVNDAQSTVQYSPGNSPIRSPLGIPVKVSNFTSLHVDIPSSTQFPSINVMTPDSNGGLLMPIPGYPVVKTVDPYYPYYYPTQKNDSSAYATPTDDTLLNESSGNILLNEHSSEGHDSSASRNSSSNSAGNASVTSDTVWRPW